MTSTQGDLPAPAETQPEPAKEQAESAQDQDQEQEIQRRAEVERSNFACLCRLLVQVTPVAFRQVFNGVHPPINLVAVLARSQTHVSLRRLMVQGLITQEHWDVLYPEKKSQASSGNYDSLLLMVLLKNICHLSPPYPNGWNGVPIQGDKSITADLTRIQWFRTLLASKEAAVNDKDYMMYRDQISEILVRLGGNAVKVQLEKIRKDLEQRKGLNEKEQKHYVTTLHHWEATSTQVNAQEARIENVSCQRGSESDLGRMAVRQLSHGADGKARGDASRDEARQDARHPLAAETGGGRSTGHIKASSTSGIGGGGGGGNRGHLGNRPGAQGEGGTKLTKEELRAHERSVLLKFQRQIMDSVASEDVVPNLVKRGLLTHEEKNRISLATKNADRMKLVLDLLPRKGGNMFDKFCDVIKYKNTSLFDKLVKAKLAPMQRVKPDEVTQCGNSLKTHYTDEYSSVSPIPWHPEITTTFQEYLAPVYLTDFRGRVLSPDQVLQPHLKCDQPKNILLEGPSGAGKSTLCQNLAYQWAQDTDNFSKRFKLVVHLDLKRVSESLLESIRRQCVLPGYPGNEGDLDRMLVRHQQHALFVLDGYEDINNIDSDVWDLVHRKVYPKSTVLLTVNSRHVTSTLLKNFDTRLLLMGLQPGSQDEVVERYANVTGSDIDDYSGLLEKIHNEKSPLHGMSLNPFYCLCTCLIAQMKGGLDFTTTSFMMQNFVAATQKLFCQKHYYQTSEDMIPDEVKDAFLQVEQFALHSLLENRVLVPVEEVFKNAQNEDKLMNLGVWQILISGSPSPSSKQQSWFCFASRIVQEFLAARCLSRLQVDDFAGHVDTLVSEQSLHGACAFFCGIHRFDFNLNTMKELIKAVVEATGPRPRHKSVLGNTSASIISKSADSRIASFSLSLECVDECEGRHDVVPLVLELLPRRLHMRQRDYHSASMIRGLAQLIKTNSSALCELELCMDHLAQYLHHEMLTLANSIEKSNHITSIRIRWTKEDMFTSFLATVFGENKSVIALHITDESRSSTRDDVSATVWSNLLTAGSNMRHLRVLAFTQCKNPAMVTGIIRNSPESLEELYLSGCRIDLIGAQELANRTERSRSLRLLNLNSARMKHAAFLQLTYALKLNKSLSELFLDDFRLDYDSALALAEALKFNTVIKHIDLGKNKFSDDSCHAVAESLGMNKSLLEASFRGADVSDDGMRMLRRMKRDNVLLIGVDGKRYVGSEEMYAMSHRNKVGSAASHRS